MPLNADVKGLIFFWASPLLEVVKNGLYKIAFIVYFMTHVKVMRRQVRNCAETKYSYFTALY